MDKYYKLPGGTMSQTKTQQLLEQVIALQPKLRERAKITRENRKVPIETVNELQELGFFLSLQPERYGGFELSPVDFFKMQIVIAEGCMSTAWACGIIAVHSFQLALMDVQAQQDVWGDNIHTRVSSSYAPMGKVEVVDGGFRFSGRWGWSSGCDHCSWALLGGVIPGEGYRTFLLPSSDYTIIDTWQSMGLQGTGSNDILVDDVFVPDYRTHKQMDGFMLTNAGKAVNPQPLFQIPWAQIFARTVSTPAIGACKEALRLFKQGALNKQSADPTKLAGDIATQERIAIAENGIDEMEAIIFRNFSVMMDTVTQGNELTIDQRILYRYQASLVIEKSIKIIDQLFEVSGGASVFTGSEIQQRFLDVHTARAHVANNPTSFSRNLGATQLGVDNKDFFI
jgi:3-hydroxy-9,10-secoandrosta-1,3,5(10)-triene-9,17-dione monooxygenase